MENKNLTVKDVIEDFASTYVFWLTKADTEIHFTGNDREWAIDLIGFGRVMAYGIEIGHKESKRIASDPDYVVELGIIPAVDVPKWNWEEALGFLFDLKDEILGKSAE